MTVFAKCSFFILLPQKKKNKDTQEVSYCYEFYFIVLATFPESHVDLPAGVQMYPHYYEEKWVTQSGLKIISKGK